MNTPPVRCVGTAKTTRRFSFEEFCQVFTSLASLGADDGRPTGALAQWHERTSRWDEVYGVVFEFEGQLWQTTYRVGLTELQDIETKDQFNPTCTLVESVQSWVPERAGYWKTVYRPKEAS